MHGRVSPVSLLLLAVPVCLLCLVYSYWLQLGNQARVQSCASNLRQIGLALATYTQDHDGRFPLAGNMSGTSRTDKPSVSGWTVSLQYFLKSAAIFKDGGSGPPIAPPDNDGYSDYRNHIGYSDYWYNASLANVRRQAILLPTATLSVGEGGDGRDLANAAYNKRTLPPAWLSDTNSPAYRHLGGANYLFVDGTVRWLKPEQVTTFGGRRNTFVVR